MQLPTLSQRFLSCGPRIVRLTAGVMLATTLVACSTDDRTGRAFWQPYRPNVQQGNWITQQQVDQLRPGMTREQVRFILGSPTLTPIFHADRWEYPYYMKPGYGERVERRFTVFFENDRVTHWEGDQQPTVQPFQNPDVVREFQTPSPQGYDSQDFPAPAQPGTMPINPEGMPVLEGNEAGGIGSEGQALGQPGTNTGVPEHQPAFGISTQPVIDESTLPRGTFGTRNGSEPLR